MRIKADLQDGARMFCSERTNRGCFYSFSQNKQNATQALLPVASRKTVPLGPPEILSRVHSVLVGLPVYGVRDFYQQIRRNGTRPRLVDALPVAMSELHQTASLTTFSGAALTDLLAGLAANSIGSFVNGFTPLRASVAGLFTTDILTKPGMTNSPDSFNSL